MASPVKLAHVVLQTTDVERLRTWWQEVLEAEVVWENSGLCFLTYDDEHHRLAIAAVPGVQKPVDREAAGLHHVAFTYATLEDLVGVYERLKAAGIAPSLCINHGPTLSFYYDDPDGNSAELQVDCFSSAEEATAFMNGPYFEKNPIGYRFDPDELSAQLRAGTPVDSLLVRRDVARDRNEAGSTAGGR
jgi:catechol-2,3-dioxygenase